MGVIYKRGKIPLLWMRDSLGGILGDNLGEGKCESKLSRDSRETSERVKLPKTSQKKAIFREDFEDIPKIL